MIIAGIGRLRILLAAAAERGAAPNDRAGRATLVIASTTVATLAIIWVATYLVLDQPAAAAIPFVYQVATVGGLAAISRGHSFRFFQTTQIGLMTVLPFILQWTIGGYAASSAVSLWALVAALGAVFFLGAQGAVKWFVAFCVLTLTSAVIDPYVAAIASPPPAPVRTAFFGLNVLGVSITAYLVVQYFVRQREAAIVALDAAHRRSEELLRNILPEPIAERLKDGETVVADAHPAVTVLFADIVDFTRYADQTAPAEVVRVLDLVFRAFDDIADRYGLEKIKTIGDAYLLVGGLPDARPDHVEAVARAALDLVAASRSVTIDPGTPLQIRAGIDTGPVVAGVIGRRKFSYDLWGDTVNTASRMESSSVPGRINVTARVESVLCDRFDFEPRGEITIKGKGSVAAFFLLGERQG